MNSFVQTASKSMLSLLLLPILSHSLLIPHHLPFPTCSTSSSSPRSFQEDFLLPEETSWLLSLARRGMSPISSEFGPTIYDPDSGYVMGPGAEVRRGGVGEVSGEELKRYEELMGRLKKKVMEVHGLRRVYHTAPTFIARLRSFEMGKPAHPHDEYFHVHADKNNTEHYDYSALVYLSNYGVDFTGGEFEFVDDEGGATVKVLPKKGMLVTFASGSENPHRVNTVKSGERFAWSTWWTCNSTMQLANSRIQSIHDEEL